MAEVAGQAGELVERLLDVVVDGPGPQLRAVATTLLIKAVGVADERAAIDAMIGSDDAAAMIDPMAAATAQLRLRLELSGPIRRLAADHGEDTAVRALRDHLTAQIDRWASRAVDDADSRRRAERFLAWADRPEQLRAAQERGLFAGMDQAELRALADRQARVPVSPETVLGVWTDHERWRRAVDAGVGDPVLAEWKRRAV